VKKLNNTCYRFIRPSRIRPRGWLRRQLEIQAAGLAGNLDRIWPDVRDSRWIGGECEGWERVPYWLDGFLPLAWLLEDEGMQKRALRYVESILARQQEDGWICPCGVEERARYDVWGTILICKVLALYGDLTDDERAFSAVYRALKNMSAHIDRYTLFDWGKARWFEGLIPLYWLYEKQPEEWMLLLAHKLRVQGMNWRCNFEDWHYHKPRPHGEWNFITHVVNLAMALKMEALLARLEDTPAHERAMNALALLRRDHGNAAWHFTGDECLAGLSPIQGTELCSVVEAMYSYEHLIAQTGDPFWSDMLERVAYNTLPATISPDMWTHQYVQLTNQVRCTPLKEDHTLFTTNNHEAHLFGLEPHYGCCTANMGQGWPKLALSALMEADDGAAVTAIAPVEAALHIGGDEVTVAIETEYPFRNSYKVTVRAQTPVDFTLHLRKPGFAHDFAIDGVKTDKSCIRRTWQGESTVEVTFATTPMLEQRPGGMHCLVDGPLLFALAPFARWEKVEYTRNGVERRYPYCDYHISPCSPWNYAFAGSAFVRQEHGISSTPFSPDKPPVTMQVSLAPIPWREENGTCTPQPDSRVPEGPAQPMTLIPYGCTTLRITDMPIAQV